MGELSPLIQFGWDYLESKKGEWNLLEDKQALTFDSSSLKGLLFLISCLHSPWEFSAVKRRRASGVG